MMDMYSSVSKRKQVLKSRKFVKHKKKNWRKHCDVSEVENWLEEKRKQEASGVKPAAERTDEELFLIDQDAWDYDTNNESRTLRTLKSERYSYPDTTVPPILPVPRKNRSRKVVPMETDDVIDSSEDEAYPRKLLYAQRTKIMATGMRGRKYTTVKEQIQSERLRDIWSGEHTTGQSHLHIKRPVIASLRKSSSTSIPHPGTSYNPEYIEHQRLLKKALKVEVEKKQAEDKLNRSLNVPKMTFAEREREWRQEILQGLVPGLAEKEQDAESNSDEEALGTAIVKRPVRAANKKTLKQRRKERLAKMALRAKKQKHLENIRMSEVYRIRSLKKQLRRDSEKNLEKIERRRVARINRESKRTKRLGKHPYQKVPIDVKLSDEIAGSLRLLQAEGNNSRDQYADILKRNMAAPKGPRNPARLQRHKPHVRWIESRAFDLRPEQLVIN